MKKNRKVVTLLGTALLVLGVLGACTPDEEPIKEPLKEVETSETEVKLEETKTGNTKPEEQKTEEQVQYLYENEAFRIQAVDVAEGGKKATVSGQARVYEANVQYSVEDGHDILDKGYTTATNAGPEWGDFSFTVQLDQENMPANDLYIITIYEESMADGSWGHQLNIPIDLKTYETKND